MCGRVAQSYEAVSAAARSLGVRNFSGGSDTLSSEDGQESATMPRTVTNGAKETAKPTTDPSRTPVRSENDDAKVQEDENTDSFTDNFNMSPGMDAFVLHKATDGKLVATRKIWGLVSRGGSKSSPLPPGMSKHFANLMFNARADSLYEKPTFSRLVSKRKTCLIAVDGFFEWKQVGKGNKQPYFVYRNRSNESTDDRPYLLMAGLWTGVPTGRDSEWLETFTILTTHACKSLKWLHSRMPLMLWDETLAIRWLEMPSEKLLREMESRADKTTEKYICWHAVTKDMSSIKFRSKDSVKALPKLKTVTSFFSPLKKGDSIPSPKRVQKARPERSKEDSSPSDRKAKKGKIDSFFSRKDA